jgi:hypothetical protein
MLFNGLILFDRWNLLFQPQFPATLNVLLYMKVSNWLEDDDLTIVEMPILCRRLN